MKKIPVLLLYFLAMVCLTAQTIHYVTDAVLEWDATVQTEIWIDIDGDGVGDLDGNLDPIIEPILSVQYEIGRSVDPVADRNTPSVSLITTSLLTYTDAVPVDSNIYVYAIRSVYTTASGISRSDWNWSDTNGVATPNPFLFGSPVPFLATHPLGFRRAP